MPNNFNTNNEDNKKGFESREHISKSKTSVVVEKLKDAIVYCAEHIKNAIFPVGITCDNCNNELVANTRLNLCSKCIAKLPVIGDTFCLCCGSSMQNEADYCLRCQNSQSYFSIARSPYKYDGIARNLIYQFKANKKKYIAETLSAAMADCVLDNNMKADIIVFVPMTEREKKKRTFNQSEILAYKIGERLNIPVLPALVKVREVKEQKQLTRLERQENLKDAFRCQFCEVEKRNILLVDDIFTTGATANECSRTLLRAKAREVSVVTIAVTSPILPTE